MHNNVNGRVFLWGGLPGVLFMPPGSTPGNWLRPIFSLWLAITKSGPFLPHDATHKTGQAVLSIKSSKIL
jgi:hypothetical protein